MNNKLEQFIKDNRSEFNVERPSKNVWDEIEATLPQPKRAKVVALGHVYKLMAAAAVVCIVLTSVYFIYIKEKNTQGSIANQPQQQNPIAPEYASQLKNEFNVIQTRQQELKEATASNPELYKAFLSDLQVLDSTYQMLQKQAGSTPNRDVIIKAMLQNLKLQSELLYRQLMISNELNQKEEPVKENKKETSATGISQQQII